MMEDKLVDLEAEEGAGIKHYVHVRAGRAEIEPPKVLGLSIQNKLAVSIA